MREAALLQRYAWGATALLQLNYRHEALAFLGRGRREVPKHWRTHTREATLPRAMEGTRQLPSPRIGMCYAALDAAVPRGDAARSFQRQKNGFIHQLGRGN
ncbi:hypothetical protein HAX54_034318 [Datura stramonium]|uniref:Uncharacterized protein n=1 Tax=Datura stramonium TaxID=4076 RepID=A0ABS8VF06_DATST|nr:hypothetical protein [Datura stramonium]